MPGNTTQLMKFKLDVTDLTAIILTLVLVVLTINLVRKGVGLVQQAVGLLPCWGQELELVTGRFWHEAVAGWCSS